MRPLKICFVTRALPVHRLGGLEHHLRDLVTALADRGHSIHIVTTAGGAGDAMADDKRFAITEISDTKPGNYSVRFFRAAEVVVQELHQQNHFDVIVPVEFAGLLLPSHIGDAPVVPLVHGTIDSETPLHPRFWQRLSPGERIWTLWKFRSRLPLAPAFRRMVARAPAMIVDSEFSRRELIQRWTHRDKAIETSRKTHVVPLGIDLERYPGTSVVSVPTDPGAPLRIALLGRLQKMKGLEVAIRAAAQLRLRGVAFQMTIGGSGDYARRAEKLVHKLGLHQFVRLAGHVKPDALPKFFGDNDLFLFPDLTQPAFGLVAVEAMAYGLPVVAARSGAIPEVVTGEVGWLYEPWDVSELAALLAGIAGDMVCLHEKSAAALAHKDQFTAEEMARRTEDALKLILGE